MVNLLFALSAGAQTIEKKDAAANAIISFEIMHVHFDKDTYLPGETVWFKAYLYNVNAISIAATNFYAAIYDDKGKLIQQKQYPIVEGSCYGDFVIPDSIESNRIQFRAFTKAMIIEDSTNVYQKIINVYNKANNTENVALNKGEQLLFFPEGGHVVAELQNYIAFKSTYADGKPAQTNGQIIEVERNKVVDTFFTNAMGLGKLLLIPSPRKNYKAVWKDDNGIVRETPLPMINRYGVSFHAEIAEKKLQYLVARNRTNDSLSELHLLAQMGNYKVYKADIVLPNEMEMAQVGFSIDSIPAGLMQLTLFDKHWNILQERMVFINNEGMQQPVIKRDTIAAGPKAKNTITISLPDTIFTNLSVSIADINFYDPSSTHSITQDLLLNTQLNGLDLNLGSVLLADKKNIIDLVLLTQQWKKYDWQKSTDQVNLAGEPLDNYITLAVNYKEKNQVLPEGESLNLIIKGTGAAKQLYNLKPINQTAFKKNELLFFDSVKVIYQTDKNKALGSYMSVYKDDTLAVPALVNVLQPQNIAASVKPEIQNNSLASFLLYKPGRFNAEQTIKEVVVKSRLKHNPELVRIEELDKIYTTGMFSGTVRGFQLNVLDDPTAKPNSDVASYVTYRISGVKIIDDEWSHEKYFVAEATVGLGWKQIQPIPMFLDEQPVKSIGNYDLSQVAYIKYIPGIVINSSFRSTIGAIYVYLRKGNEAEPEGNSNMHSVYIKGYNTQKDFLNPDYNNKDIAKTPDLRTTVYWNPNVIMDKTNNTIKIDYFNNDISKKLLLKIEGINAKGQLIYIEKVIE
ncbi:Plug domain-containing protein [Ferruginibacter profundus]